MDLLAVQGSLKSLLQHHSSKASVLQHSAFFIAQLSHLYKTTGETIALTRQTMVGKVMSLFSNMLSRLVIAFLPRSRHLLISWLKSPSAVILEDKKIKSVTVSIVSPSICHEVMGLDAMILVFRMLSFKGAIHIVIISETHTSRSLHLTIQGTPFYIRPTDISKSTPAQMNLHVSFLQPPKRFSFWHVFSFNKIYNDTLSI